MRGSELGAELRRIRAIRGHSLREVEEATGVSNAYLSQIESGKATNPSPHILHKLAHFYDVAYEGLLASAGYLNREVSSREDEEASKPRRRLSNIRAALLSEEFTEEEDEQIVQFIEFLRSRRKGR